MNWKKELRDQSLHLSIGFVLTLLFSMTVHVTIAAVIVFLGTWIREILQRISKGNPWYQCQSGCMLDLLFWAIGISTAIGVSYVFIQ